MLIDSNIFMYAAGAPHAHKRPCERLLRRVLRGEVEGLIDAEVLQEILHRYRAIGRWEQGRRVYDLTRRLIPTVVPISFEITDDARGLMDRYHRLSARDAIHAAVCRKAGNRKICSYDGGFDEIDGLTRLEPHQVP